MVSTVHTFIVLLGTLSAAGLTAGRSDAAQHVASAESRLVVSSAFGAEVPGPQRQKGLPAERVVRSRVRPARRRDVESSSESDEGVQPPQPTALAARAKPAVPFSLRSTRRERILTLVLGLVPKKLRAPLLWALWSEQRPVRAQRVDAKVWEWLSASSWLGLLLLPVWAIASYAVAWGEMVLSGTGSFSQETAIFGSVGAFLTVLLCMLIFRALKGAANLKELLHYVRSFELRSALRVAVQSPEPALRRAAIQSFGLLKGHQPLESLEAVLLQDGRDLRDRIEAAKALTTLGWTPSTTGERAAYELAATAASLAHPRLLGQMTQTQLTLLEQTAAMQVQGLPSGEATPVLPAASPCFAPETRTTARTAWRGLTR
jgi:hypothetical protein